MFCHVYVCCVCTCLHAFFILLSRYYSWQAGQRRPLRNGSSSCGTSAPIRADNPSRYEVVFFLLVFRPPDNFDVTSNFSYSFCSVACLFQLLDKESLKLPFCGREQVAKDLWELTRKRYAAIGTGNKEKHPIPFYIGQPGIGK